MQSHLSRRYVSILLGLALFISLMGAAGEMRAQAEENRPAEDDVALVSRIYTPGNLTKRIEAGTVELENSSPAPELPSNAAASGDWSVAVYSRFLDGSFDLFLVHPGISSERLTSTGNLDEMEARLKPDGSEFVFTLFVGNESKIFKRRIGTAGNTQLTTTGLDSYPFWSPDGSKIVFQSSRDGQSEIYIMDADGSNQTRLTNDPDYDGQPSFTPDGQHILFVSRRTGGYRIYQMDVDGSNVVQLSTLPYSASPFVTYNGLLFSADSDLDGWLELWLSDLDGSNPRLLHSPGPSQDLLASVGTMGGGYTRITWKNIDGTWYITAAKISASFGTPLSWGYDWISLDKEAPVTTVEPLPPLSSRIVELHVSVVEHGPAGLPYYPTTVQYRDGLDGEWIDISPWALWTTEFAFYGVGGHTYYVRARSMDAGYNVEPWPDAPQAVTTIESSPPVSVFGPMQQFQPETFSWQIAAADAEGSGISEVQVQARQDGTAAWVDVPTDISGWGNVQGSFEFTGVAGATYTFRMRARDGAENWEDWHTAPLSVTLYSWELSGTASDITGIPLGGVSAHLSSGYVGGVSSDVDGMYRIYGTSSYTHGVSWQWYGQDIGVSAVYTDSIVENTPDSVDIIVPPVDDLLQNGDFETGRTQWDVSGTYPAGIAAGGYQHIGKHMAVLGQEPFLKTTILSGTPAGGWLDDNPVIVFDSQEQPHVFVISDDGNAYALLAFHRRNDGTWSGPEVVLTSNSLMRLANAYLLSDGTIRILFEKRDMAGSLQWFIADYSSSGSATVYGVDLPPNVHLMTVQRGNILHVMYRVYDTSTWRWVFRYVRILEDGSLMDVETVGKDARGYLHLVDFSVDGQGNVYALFGGYKAGRLATRSAATGTWGPLEPIASGGVQDQTLKALVIDQRGYVHVLVVGSINDYGIYDIVRDGSGWRQAYLIMGLSSISENQIFKDASGHVHVYGSGDNAIWYRQMSPDGQWQNKELFVRTFSPYLRQCVPTRVVGDEIYAYWNGVFKHDARRGWLLSAGGDSLYFPSASCTSVALGANGDAHVVSTWSRSLQYASLSRVDAGAVARLTRQVTVPVTMTNPTLSFLAYGFWADETSWKVDVTPQGGSATSLSLQANPMDTGWVHYWGDVSAWKGQTITLTFEISRQAGDVDAALWVDNITLGSVLPDIWTGVSAPRGALPGQVLPVMVSYGNRSWYEARNVQLTITLSDSLQVLSSTLTSMSVTGNTLTWNWDTLPARTSGSVVLWVNVQTPPDGQNVSMIKAQITSAVSGDANPQNNQDIREMDFQTHLFLPLVAR